MREIADQVTVLRDGRSVGGGAAGSLSIGEMIGLMVGRSVEELYPRSAHVAGEVVLDVAELAGVAKPRGASLQLRRGEVLGIAGLVGAGRTELLRAIFGLEKIKSGKIRLGSYIGPASPTRRWGQGVGLVSEDRKSEGLALNLSVAENLTLPSLGAVVWPGREAAASQTWIERLGIRCRGPGQRVGDLSGGNQQKVALGRLLNYGVDVLLLDEPTRGIDVGSKSEIYRLIDKLACAGKAVLMVSSYLPELLGVCDRVAVMCKGRLTQARRVNELTEHDLLTQAIGAENQGVG